ncbi:MAG TPA: GNAT family N-acetyltransferase [Anaerolineales bacterium]|nr:GNAT family N-acetyltransferase [Anaerolineales bacterium]
MMTKLDERTIQLPTGYTARNARIEDYKIAFDLSNLYSQRLNGRVDLTDPELVRLDWLSNGFNPATDVLIVLAPDGSPVAFVECWLIQEPPVHPWIFGRVHPDHWGKGIGRYLLTWAEDHAHLALEKCAPDLRVAPRSGVEAHNKAALALFESLGWKRIRSFYRMVIDLEHAPEPQPFPEGIIVRPYNPETELEAVYRTFVDTFRDHFGFIVPPFEKGFADFKHNFVEEPGYDPDLWFVAFDGDEMVGICLCRREDPEDPEAGWISELGVCRKWRKRGLGSALLKHAFATFYVRGKKRVCLGVDAESLTGALHLYERAGMRVQRQFDQYEKEIRPGRELAVESLQP